MLAGFAKTDVEEAALGWLETLGYTVRHGPEIAFGVVVVGEQCRDQSLIIFELLDDSSGPKFPVIPLVRSKLTP